MSFFVFPWIYTSPSAVYFSFSIDVLPALLLSDCANSQRLLFLVYFQIALEINEINFWKNKEEKSKWGQMRRLSNGSNGASRRLFCTRVLIGGLPTTAVDRRCRPWKAAADCWNFGQDCSGFVLPFWAKCLQKRVADRIKYEMSGHWKGQRTYFLYKNNFLWFMRS